MRGADGEAASVGSSGLVSGLAVLALVAVAAAMTTVWMRRRAPADSEARTLLSKHASYGDASVPAAVL